MPVDYDHGANRHTLAGPRAVLPVLFAAKRPRSLLDVGCGIGTWLRAAVEAGIEDVFGIDGVEIGSPSLLVRPDRFLVVDLTGPWNLRRRFDVALCLEVGEHLDREAAPHLVHSLAGHADEVVFSAACPGQPGQHHVNCQWPAFWQAIFNAHGFACTDAIRWAIWDDPAVEVWYRQNMFVARRDPAAGTEPRLKAVIHPDFIADFVRESATRAADESVYGVRTGTMPIWWYGTSIVQAMAAKARRRLSSSKVESPRRALERS